MKYKAVARTVEREIFVDFDGDDEQLHTIMDGLRAHRDQIDELLTEKKRISDALKEEQAEQDRLVGQLLKGKPVKVECEEQYIGDLSLVRTVRTDTGEAVLMRAATQEDMQTEMGDTEIEVEISEDEHFVRFFDVPNNSADESVPEDGAEQESEGDAVTEGTDEQAD